jgi:hypothetical protein
MALILAIEPDRRQAAQLTSLIRARVNADLVLAETAEQALHAIGDRVPDLVLVPALLAPQDDATLAGALRVIAAAARIQMLTIPVLATTSRKKKPQGVLAKWRRLRAEPAASGGCDPAMFGDQIAAYLAEAAAERAVNQSDHVAAAPADSSMHNVPAPSAGTAPVGEALGHAAIESIPVPEVAQAAIETVTAAFETSTAAFEEVAVLGNTQTPAFAGVVGDLDGEGPAVDEPQDEPAVETMPAEPLPEPGRADSSHVEELRFIEAPIETLGPVTVEVAGGNIPVAVDAISLSPTEDAWDTVEEEEFFLGAFEAGELVVDEPAVYELQTDDLSIDLVSFDEAPVAQSHRPTIVTVQPDQARQPVPLEVAQPVPLKLTQPAPHELVSFGARPRWPNLEGMVAETLSAAAPVIAEPPVTAEKLAVLEAAVAVPTAPAAKPEWLELIDSLRRDVERLRGQRTQPPPIAAARTREASSRTAAQLPGAAGPVSLARTPSVVDVGAKTKKRSGSAKPAEDEWGFFDPEQCGFAALLAKLDEITHLNDGV